MDANPGISLLGSIGYFPTAAANANSPDDTLNGGRTHSSVGPRQSTSTSEIVALPV